MTAPGRSRLRAALLGLGTAGLLSGASMLVLSPPVNQAELAELVVEGPPATPSMAASLASGTPSIRQAPSASQSPKVTPKKAAKPKPAKTRARETRAASRATATRSPRRAESTASASPKKSATTSSAAGLGSAVERETVRLTNAERVNAGCDALRTHARLVEAAGGHSADMAVRDYFSHTSPEGLTFVDRAKAAGYPSPGGENIAWGQPTAAAVVGDWMASPGHRQNILNCNFTTIGVGFDSRGKYWTQVFGY
jgi:uncharacterized protein YkwD